MVIAFPVENLLCRTDPHGARTELSAHDTGSAMTTWEYLTTPLLIHNTAQILNNWGKQGWELVQVVDGARKADSSPI